MASTYTTNLRLTKQGDGENPNSWGQILNDGVISLVDDAIAGYAQVSLGSGTTVTLTNNQGSGDQARSAMLEFTGSIGGTNDSITVLIPNNSKTYIIKNSVSYTDTSDKLIIKVAGNTGVTLTDYQTSGPPSLTAMYVTNGTTVLPVTQTDFTNIRATGNLNVLGATSLSGAVNMVGNAAIGGTLTVTGAVSLASTLSVGGATYIAGTVTVSGKGSFTTGAVTPIVTLTDGASVSVNLNTGNIFYVTLAGNRTLAAPENTSTNIGQTGHIFIQQDSTGSRTLGYNTAWRFPAGTVPVLTETANAVDALFYAVRTTAQTDAILVKNFTR